MRLAGDDPRPGLLGRLRARLCADCGYVELFADDPMPVYLQHVRAVTGRDAGAPPGAGQEAPGGPANLQCPSCGSLIPAASAACDVCGWSPRSA